MKQSMQKTEMNAVAKARKLEEEKSRLEEEIVKLREAQESPSVNPEALQAKMQEWEREKEFEMRRLQEENERVNAENMRLLSENGECAGHSNPSQKIKHHMKIKEENNKLKAEVFQL